MPALRIHAQAGTCVALLSFAASLFAGAAGQAAPQYVNSVLIPGNQLDLSGGTTVNTGRFGNFSDLYYDRYANQWWGLSDRGPGGGTLDYNTRVSRFSLDVNKATGAISNFKIEQTVLFQQGGQFFNGKAPNPSNVLGRSLDPEGFVILPTSGNFLVSDEYGPSAYEFSPLGNFIRAYDVPSNFVPKVGANTDYNAAPPPGAGTLTAGREGNRGLEGLAVSPDGKFAFAMLQNGTITDGSVGSSFNRSLYTRIVKYDTATGAAVGEFAYKLESTGQGRGISALVALDDNRFLVLERNNRGLGVPNANLSPADKKVFTIDLSGATDVTGINLTTPLPSNAVAATKTTPAFIDLAASNTLLPELGNISPEKWEGLAVGPQLDDGSYLVLAGTDNDYSVTQNGSNTQFDVYFKPNNPNNLRAQCALDQPTPTNCVVINPDGSVGTTAVTDTSVYSLIPGVLQAWKVSSQDLGGYTPPAQPVPGPLPLLGASMAMAWSRRLRRRLRA